MVLARKTTNIRRWGETNTLRSHLYPLILYSPMRFPVSLTYTETSETLYIQDHKLVFQLADVLNQMNADIDPVFQVGLVPWIQTNPA